MEIKAAVRPTANHFKHLASLRDKLGEEFLAGVVVNSETAARAGAKLWSIPVAAMGR